MGTAYHAPSEEAMTEKSVEQKLERGIAEGMAEMWRQIEILEGERNDGSSDKPKPSLLKRMLRGAGQGYLDGRDKRLKDQCPEASGTDLLIQRLNGIISRLEIEKQGLRKLIEDLCRQYAYEAENPAGLCTGGMSVLEEAFEVLEWKDPHPMPELKCDEPGCGKVATCGFPVPDDKYRRTCGLHFHPQEE